jgi:hypothetical protein
MRETATGGDSMDDYLKNLRERAVAAQRAHRIRLKEQENQARRESEDHFTTMAAPLRKLLSEITPLIQSEARRLTPEYTRLMKEDWRKLVAIRRYISPRQTKGPFELPTLYIDLEKRLAKTNSEPGHTDGALTWSVGRRLSAVKRRSIKWSGTFEVYEATFKDLEALDESHLKFNRNARKEYSELNPHQNQEINVLESQAELAIAAQRLLGWIAETQLTRIIADDLERRLAYLETFEFRRRRPGFVVTRLK